MRIDLEDRQGIEDVFKQHKPERVVNLAAQAGVRYSIENPHAYVDTRRAIPTIDLQACGRAKANSSRGGSP